MPAAKHLKIAIASAAHRAHYVDWFKEALLSQGVTGEVIALEYRASAPTLAYADAAVIMPAYNSPEYRGAVVEWARNASPDFFISLNDYELQILADGLADDLRELGCTVAALDSAAQSAVLDKHLMAATLHRCGIPTPTTWLGSEAAQVIKANPGGAFVVKHRFGSGSAGLVFASAQNLRTAVFESAELAKAGDGRASVDGLDAVIIQERLPGTEFGVDGIFSLRGTGELRGVLARRKDRMRSGDTDVATTVAADRFAGSLAALGRILKPVGAIDVDFKESADGSPLIIDVNPRFGGGYPFCHLAGADVPADIVRMLAGLDDDRSLLNCEPGITSARREGFALLGAAVIGRPPLISATPAEESSRRQAEGIRPSA